MAKRSHNKWFRRRGNIATLLLLITLCACMTFAIAYRFIARQRYTRQFEFGTQAENNARSGLAMTIANVRKDPQWGTQPGNYELQYTMPHPGDPRSGFTLTFDPSKPGHSVNNVRSDTPVSVDGTVCPAGAMYLIATGHCNGYTRVMKAVIAVAPFKYAIASQGRILSEGGMVLGSVPEGFDPSGGLNVDDLKEAELLSNGTGNGALTIHGRSTIVGNGRVVGSLDVDNTLVDLSRAELREGQTADEIPDIDLASVGVGATPQRLPESTFNALEKLSGGLEWSPAGGEPLHFKQGLQLNGATLRVHGDVVIEGEFSGTGALLVDGDVTIRGGARLSSDNQCAIIAEGSVSITGQGQGTSYVQGLVYAAGDQGVKLQDVTVLGTLLNNGPNGAATQLDRAGVVFDEKSTSIEIDMSGTAGYLTNTLTGGRLKHPLPYSNYYTNGGWDVPGNVRPEEGPSPSNPYGLSALELDILPHMEFKFTVGGQERWFASPQAAIAGGIPADKVYSVVRLAMGKAGVEYAQKLANVSSGGPPETNSTSSFRLDLNRYLRTQERLRVLRLIPG